jgi:hypothetical protein
MRLDLDSFNSFSATLFSFSTRKSSSELQVGANELLLVSVVEQGDFDLGSLSTGNVLVGESILKSIRLSVEESNKRGEVGVLEDLDRSVDNAAAAVDDDDMIRVVVVVDVVVSIVFEMEEIDFDESGFFLLICEFCDLSSFSLGSGGLCGSDVEVSISL